MSSFIFPDNGFEWRNESLQKPPKGWHYVRESGANGILKAAYQNIATVWQGDFHNAKQVLSAMKKKVRKPAAVRSDADIAALFHAHRMKQAQQSRILNMLAVEIRPGFVLDNKRAPDIRSALLDVYGEADGKPFFLPLNLLLGFMGAHEWHKKGVAVPQLGGSIHVPFGVFSPLRGEYLDLLAHAPSTGFQTAF
ncbi:TPA: methyltransferase, partial [Neisseria meningitidis]